MQAGRGKPNNNVTGFNRLAGDDALALDHADDKSREIVFPFGIKTGHLRRLAANQRAAVMLAGFCEPFNHFFCHARIELTRSQVIHKEHGRGALHRDVVYAVVHEVRADGMVNFHLKGKLQFGSDAVDAGDEDGIDVLGLINREQSPEAPDLAEHAFGEGFVGQVLDALLSPIGLIDIDASISVRNRFGRIGGHGNQFTVRDLLDRLSSPGPETTTDKGNRGENLFKKRLIVARFTLRNSARRTRKLQRRIERLGRFSAACAITLVGGFSSSFSGTFPLIFCDSPFIRFAQAVYSSRNPKIVVLTGDVSMADERARAIDLAFAQIEKQFGKGSIMRLGSKEAIVPISVISTGAISFDAALGVGGVPRGRVVEIFGPESSGKTTIALQVIAQAQAQGGMAAFVDAEHALDPGYAKKLGVDVDNLLVSQPDYGEQALEITEALVRSGAIDVLVVDSVAALVPKAELDGEMGDSHMGLQARLMSQALRKLTGTVSKSRTCLIFINQIREKIGVMFGNPETTTGGRALKFYASVRVDIRRIAAIKEGDVVTGSRTKVKIVKNKVAAPFRESEFDILYGEGISREGDLLDLAANHNILEKSGSWYSYKGERIGQGRENARQFLKDNKDVMAKLETEVRKALGLIPTQPVQAQSAAQAAGQGASQGTKVTTMPNTGTEGKAPARR